MADFVPLEMIDLSPPAAPKLLVSPRLMEIYLCKKGKVISNVCKEAFLKKNNQLY